MYLKTLKVVKYKRRQRIKQNVNSNQI